MENQGVWNMNFEREFPGPNLGYVLELYERYQRNPDSVASVVKAKYYDGCMTGIS